MVVAQTNPIMFRIGGRFSGWRYFGEVVESVLVDAIDQTPPEQVTKTDYRSAAGYGYFENRYLDATRFLTYLKGMVTSSAIVVLYRC